MSLHCSSQRHHFSGCVRIPSRRNQHRHMRSMLTPRHPAVLQSRHAYSRAVTLAVQETLPPRTAHQIKILGHRQSKRTGCQPEMDKITKGCWGSNVKGCTTFGNLGRTARQKQKRGADEGENLEVGFIRSRRPSPPSGISNFKGWHHCSRKGVLE